MCMQLRRGVAVHWPRTVVLKGGRNPAARRVGRMVATDPRLHEPFTLVEGGDDTGAMRVADPIIAADERRERDAFRRGEGRIPGRAMRDGRDRLTMVVGVRASGLMADNGRPRLRMLA